MEKYISPLCEETLIGPSMAIAISASIENVTNTDVDINWFD